MTCKEIVLYLGEYRSAGACLDEYVAAARGHPLLPVARDARDAVRAARVIRAARVAHVARAAGARVPAARLQ